VHNFKLKILLLIDLKIRMELADSTGWSVLNPTDLKPLRQDLLAYIV